MTRVYSRHGVNTLRKDVAKGLDQRTAVAKTLKAWKAELIADCGGDGALTAGQRVLIEAIIHARLYLARLDAYLVDQDQYVIGSKHTILPALRQRQDIQDSLAKLLTQLQEHRAAKGKRRSLLDDIRSTKQP